MHEARKRPRHGTKRPKHRTGDVHREPIGQIPRRVVGRALAAGQSAEIAPLDELEDQVRAVVVVADRKKRHHVGVTDAREEPSFFPERADVVGPEVPENPLDADFTRTGRRMVYGAEDGPRPPASNALPELVAAICEPAARVS
jgi:hypothetical protein